MTAQRVFRDGQVGEVAAKGRESNIVTIICRLGCCRLRRLVRFLRYVSRGEASEERQRAAEGGQSWLAWPARLCAFLGRKHTDRVGSSIQCPCFKPGVRLGHLKPVGPSARLTVILVVLCRRLGLVLRFVTISRRLDTASISLLPPPFPPLSRAAQF